jgi:hypothetical protein
MQDSADAQCWIRTDLGGFITSTDVTCWRLLNLTPSGAEGKELLLFFVRNRLEVAGEMRGVLRSGIGGRRIAAEFRPRDRRATTVEVSISQPDPASLEWRFWLS